MTYEEKAIFLAAMDREARFCKDLNNGIGLDMLRLCKDVIRIVKKSDLWKDEEASCKYYDDGYCNGSKGPERCFCLGYINHCDIGEETI